jgi:hypothetical protein
MSVFSPAWVNFEAWFGLSQGECVWPIVDVAVVFVATSVDEGGS